jgi:OHCU decarboxylase
VRAHPAEYELVAPRTLPAVLSLLAQDPGAWLPIAGGTDVMVQYSAGKLSSHKLVSIWNLPELRRIDISADEIQIGAGCTYTDLRANETINREFPLLASAAAWTGGIANQNRGTLGGNIVNASPAADSLPALMAYEAELLLVSALGERRVPYANFHIGYRKTQLAPGELIRAVCLKQQFSGYYAHARKVGARNAQAISKVCLAALGHLADGIVDDLRLAVGSVAPVPMRLTETERIVKGNRIEPHLIQLAKTAAAREIRPIDDIRSTSRYRVAVTANLVAEFLEQLGAHAARTENSKNVLARWNGLPSEKAAEEILPCCGSKSWTLAMANRRPILDESALLAACDEVCKNLPESDWLEAFRSHPRIGDSLAPASATAQSAAWSGEEQRKAGTAGDDIKAALAAGNRVYEQKFNRIFIVCAAGKTAPDILAILERRLRNEESVELKEAAEQQRQIAHLRLKKWLSQ